MNRLCSGRIARGILAAALVLWAVPFGRVAQASELEVAQVAAQAEGGAWSGGVDTSWYSASGADFTLTTPEQLAGLAAIVNGEAAGIARDDFMGKTVTLGADVTLNATPASSKAATGQRNWAPIGKIVQTGVDESKGYAAPTYDYSARFNGTFDGAGHVVRNIFRYAPDEEYGGFSGLFGVLGDRAVVTRVGVEGGYVYGRVAGGIAAASRVGVDEMAGGGPLIDSCFNSATIEGNGSSTRAVGGIFGGQEAYDVSLDSYQAMARIENCHNAGSVKGSTAGSPTGGIAGYGSLRISGCLNTGSVSGGGDNVRGQIAGAVLKAGYQNDVHGTGVGDFYGGFVRNCNATGSGVMCHVLAEPGDENRGDATVPSAADLAADGVYSIDLLDWADPEARTYSVGDAFAVVESGGWPDLQLRWRAGLASTALTDGCIVGGVKAAYLASDSGAAIAPKPVVRVDGKELVEDVDYAVSFLDACGSAVEAPAAVGDYTLVVTGKTFSGSATRAFSIEDAWLNVYSKASASAEPVLVKSYLKDEVKALAGTSGERVSAMYGAAASDGSKGDSWHVMTSMRYVGVDALLADAGVSTWKSGAALDVRGAAASSTAFSYEGLHDGWFYPEATQRGFSTANGVKVPAVLALFCGDAEVASGRTAEYAQVAGANRHVLWNSLRLLCGVSKADYAAKKLSPESRLVPCVSSLTVIAPSAAPVKKTDLSKMSVSVKDQVWSGKSLTPAVTVKMGKTTLRKGVDYTVSYSANRNVGTAKAIVKAKSGSAKYVGSKTATFKINPKGTTLSKLARGMKQLTATWKKQAAQVTGYQLLLATNSKFTSGKKTVTVKNAKAARAVVKGLKAKTKYWAKVRTFKTVGKKTYYSAWSKALSAKTS